MTAAPTPAVHVFRHSRAKAWLLLVLLVPFSLVSVGTALATVFLIGKLAYAAAAVGTLMFGLLEYQLVKQLRDREVVLVLDAEGLTDRRREPQHIPWRSLARVDHSTLRSSQVMLLTFVDGAAANRYVGPGGVLDLVSMRLDHMFTGLRPHGALELSSLEGSPRRVVQLAQALHARANGRARPGRAAR